MAQFDHTTLVEANLVKRLTTTAFEQGLVMVSRFLDTAMDASESDLNSMAQALGVTRNQLGAIYQKALKLCTEEAKAIFEDRARYLRPT